MLPRFCVRFHSPTQFQVLPTNKTTDSFSSQLTKTIHQHLSREELDNTFLSRELCMSEAQFYRAVKSNFGCSPNVLLRRFRLDKAKNLLKSGSHNVQDVAYAVGFNHVSYFIRRFEERFGISPGEMLRGAQA